MWGDRKLAKIAWSDSLAPPFVKSDYVTAELTAQRMHAMRYLLGLGHLCVAYLYDLHLESGGITAASQLCPLGQPGKERILQLLRWPGERLCCVRVTLWLLISQERIKVSAVAMAPQGSFQAPSSHLACPGFSKQGRQCEQQDT